MPPRLARSSIPSSVPKLGKGKTRKRNLDAYAIASHSTTSQRPVRQSRLGEYLDDAPKQKRARAVQDDDGEDSDEEGAPSAPKRRRTAGEDAQGGDEGSDSEGNKWRLGGLRSDDDDSELDSDAAFGDSDEDKFEGFTFRGSKSTGSKNVSQASKQRFVDDDDGDMDLNEDIDGEEDDGDEDGFGDEGVDLATMLDDDDDDDDDDNDDAVAKKDRTRHNTFEEDDSDGYDSGDEDEDSEVDFSITSDEDDGQNDEERAARMQDRLDALNKAGSFATATKSAPAALTVDDLLAPSDPASRQQRDTTLNPRKKPSRPQTVSAPLPKRQQDRLNREVATAKAKDQLDRWRDTVIHNRRAEFLSFPFKHTDEVEPMGKDKFIIDNNPQNELEERIQRIMEESGLSTSTNKRDQAAEEDAILTAEGLGTNKLPVEEVMRRRAELRRTRELLFREERKAKRISKIKSRSYRRVHRKERERLAQLEEGVRGSDDEEDVREASDRKRAMARMSTKHKDSKFAKALKETNRGVWDEEARDAVLDEARRREELVRRIRGEDIGEGSDVDSGGEDDEGWDGLDGDDGIKEQLNRLKEDSRTREDEGKGKGLQNMKFMRAAHERRKVQNDEDVERMRKELAVQVGDEESDDAAVNNQGLGRAVFGPTAKKRVDWPKAKRGELEEAEESDVEDDKSHDEVDVITEKHASGLATPEKPGHLLARRANPGKAMSARTDQLHQPAASDWITAKTNKPFGNGPAGQQNGKSDWLTAKTNRGRALTKEPTIDISLLEPPTSNAGAPPDKDFQTLTHMEYPRGHPGIASTGAVEPDAARKDVNRTVIGHNEHSRQQVHDYHTRAFAGDDVAASFAAEKSALATEEDDQVTSSHLPGWGSWTGAGLSKSLRRANAKQKHNPLFKTKTVGVHQADRKDAGKANVIVSEKRMKRGKGKELLASVLPRQFETREQYERSLRVPVGPEWTTKEVFQRSTRPRVVVEKGTVVEALERPLV